MTVLLHQEITGQLIGAYYTVYNRLGSTYPEYILEKAMMLVLRRASAGVCSQGPDVANLAAGSVQTIH